MFLLGTHQPGRGIDGLIQKQIKCVTDSQWLKTKIFLMIHLQAGHSKDDSFETKDIVFYDNIPISQSSKPSTSAPTETGKNSLFEPTPSMTKEPGTHCLHFFTKNIMKR